MTVCPTAQVLLYISQGLIESSPGQTTICIIGEELPRSLVMARGSTTMCGKECIDSATMDSIWDRLVYVILLILIYYTMVLVFFVYHGIYRAFP